jgi:hypothetical protein
MDTGAAMAHDENIRKQRAAVNCMTGNSSVLEKTKIP